MAKVFTITEGLENMGALKTGGQGSVYKGRRIGEIITAVKLLPTPVYSESPDDKHFTDFQNEVQKLKRVNARPNPNVVRILSSGITETGSLPFIEMEYVEGPDLEELLKPPHDPVFTVREAIKVADQLSNALSHCHQVGVKHGDIKTNNIKFNVHTGNYVLLDFGMSMMSDEQRRTSLRHAGAIEFMAPEQNEGQILFQTDIYSFGIVLFELLAGTVPFPLKDRGETARNTVMVAHMETPPPDLLSLRRQALPAEWSEEKKAAEMQVPEWLVNTIYICLEKKPESRFADGKALHEYIVLRNTKTVMPVVDTSELTQLKMEKEQLLREKEVLQRKLALLERQGVPLITTAAPEEAALPSPRRRASAFWTLLILAVVGGAIFLWYRKGSAEGSGKEKEPSATPTRVIGRYKVRTARAYFHNEPDLTTRREGFMVPSEAIILATDEKNGFIYTSFTNNRGQTSRGWLWKADLVPLEQWKNSEAPAGGKPTPEQIAKQLAEARQLQERGNISAALAIYNPLAEQGVPEAMYEAGNYGLQNLNEDMTCSKALLLVKTASDKGFPPAKRTLGFLYFFADNREVLQINNYDSCPYERNVYRGTKLLMEAVMAGDTTAKRLVEELNIARMPGADEGGRP